MRLSELEAVVESLLFIAGDAVPLASIAQTIELDQATTRAVVLSLADKYEKEKRPYPAPPARWETHTEVLPNRLSRFL